jgi:hypothetical protein
VKRFLLAALPGLLLLGQLSHAQYYLGEYYACLSASGRSLLQIPSADALL